MLGGGSRDERVVRRVVRRVRGVGREEEGCGCGCGCGGGIGEGGGKRRGR